MSRKKLFSQKEKKEILWNVINSSLAGFLVLLGAFTTGDISFESCMAAFVVSCVVIVSKFKEYWDGERKEYLNHFANFL